LGNLSDFEVIDVNTIVTDSEPSRSMAISITLFTAGIARQIRLKVSERKEIPKFCSIPSTGIQYDTGVFASG
jgi:hypothetical protein